MIISHVLGDCDACKSKDSYGVCIIANNHMIIGCGKCNQRKTLKLPNIRKNILYLDQCFYSRMFRKNNKRIMEIGEQIARLANKQQLITPFTSIHEIESLQWESKDKQSLYDFIRKVSRGHQFKLEAEVKTRQLHRSFLAYLDGTTSVSDVTEEDAIDGKVHQWDGYVRIDIKHSLENPEETRALKKQYVEELAKDFLLWRKDNLSFMELLQAESTDVAFALLRQYHDMNQRYMSPDPMAFMNAPADGEIVCQLVHTARECYKSLDHLGLVKDFMSSDYFRKTPFVFVKAAIQAKLRQKIQQGHYSNNEKAKKTFIGFPFDVEFISVYGPYCDAMFLDKAMHNWLAENDIMFDKKFGVRLFSAMNLTELEQYLYSLEESLSSGIQDIIQLAYGGAKKPSRISF